VKFHLPGAPFIVSIFLWTITAITPIIALNYASESFDVQEFKRYSSLLLLSGTMGTCVIGAIVYFIPKEYDVITMLGLMAVVEFASVLCVKALANPQSPKIISKNQPSVSTTIKTNQLFKYLALIIAASAIISTLIDYNLKLSLATQVNPQQFTKNVNIIYILSMLGTLLMQVVFLNYLLRMLGSQRLILIFPMVMLLGALMAIYPASFIWIAILFIINQIVLSTTFLLSKSLYLNILPQSIRNLGRFHLDGTIKPISIALAAIVIFGLTYSKNPRFSLMLIILFSLYTLYISRQAIKEYGVQLVQSVYLRRFNPSLINASQLDDHTIELVLNQALNSSDTEAKLFILQLMNNQKLERIPPSIAKLLHVKNKDILHETAKLLAKHKDQREFEQEAKQVFLRSRDDTVRWYLTLYLLENKQEKLLPHINKLPGNKTRVSAAIACLVHLKQGNLDQQTQAMNYLCAMQHDDNDQSKKWFLRLLNELPHLLNEFYVSNLIQENNLALNMLALQQISPYPSHPLLTTLVDQIGKPGSSHALNNILIKMGDRVSDLIEQKLTKSSTYSIKISCIVILSNIMGERSQRCLISRLHASQDMVIKTVIAKYLAYYGVKKPIDTTLRSSLIQMVKKETSQFLYLSTLMTHYDNPLITIEIDSRMQMIKKRILYYLSCISGSTEILNSVPLLTSPDTNKQQKAIVLELIDINTHERFLLPWLMILFTDQPIKSGNLPSSSLMEDPFLESFLHDLESNHMDSIYLLTKLRKVDLFKHLAAETLLVLSECCVSRDMSEGEIIFNEGDQGDGLYIIDTGTVSVTKGGMVLAYLTEGAYFGELALLSDTPRFATITATSEGALLYIDKQDFDRITDELPEIMKSINKQVIHYLTTMPRTTS
jgi:hypothetical protein